MKNQKENEKNTNQKENKVVYVATSINTCIACGREIPEGKLVCMECEIGNSERRCAICNRAIADNEAICQNCRDILFRSKSKG